MSQLDKAKEAYNKAVADLKSFKEELDAKDELASAEDIQKLQDMATGVGTASETVSALKDVTIPVEETIEFTEEVSAGTSQTLNMGVNTGSAIQELGIEEYKGFAQLLSGKAASFDCNYLMAKKVFMLQQEGAGAKEAVDMLAQEIQLATETNLATTISSTTGIAGMLPTRFDTRLYRIMADRDGLYKYADVRSENVQPGNTVNLPKLTSYGNTPNAAVGEVAESAEINPVFGTTAVTVDRRAVHKDLSDTVVKGTSVDMIDATMTNLMYSLMDDIEAHITAQTKAVSGRNVPIGNNNGMRREDYGGIITSLDTGYFRDSNNLPMFFGTHVFYVNQYALREDGASGNNQINRLLDENAISTLAGDTRALGFKYVLSAHFNTALNAATSQLLWFGLPNAAIVVGETGTLEFASDIADIKNGILTLNLQTYLGAAIQDTRAMVNLIGKA